MLVQLAKGYVLCEGAAGELGCLIICVLLRKLGA